MSWGAQNRSKDAKTPTFAPAMSRKPKPALCGIQPYISAMNIMYISEDDVVRKEPHSYDCTAIHAHGRGCRDLYSFEGVRTNCLQSRVFSCWCVPCTCTPGGLVSWYEVHQAAHPAVESSIPTAMQLLQRGVGRCENNEEWDVQAIHENSDRGIQAQRAVM